MFGAAHHFQQPKTYGGLFYQDDIALGVAFGIQGGSPTLTTDYHEKDFYKEHEILTGGPCSAQEGVPSLKEPGIFSDNDWFSDQGTPYSCSPY